MLRSASGIRNAEMKWSDHLKLSTYGVRLVGWPSGVPMQNPSTMSVAQNRLIREALDRGTMYFERLSTGFMKDSATEPQANVSNGRTQEVKEEQWQRLDVSPNLTSWTHDELQIASMVRRLILVTSSRASCLIILPSFLRPI